MEKRWGPQIGQKLYNITLFLAELMADLESLLGIFFDMNGKDSAVFPSSKTLKYFIDNL